MQSIIYGSPVNCCCQPLCWNIILVSFMQQELWRAWRAWSSRWMSIDIPPRGSASWVAKRKIDIFHDKQVTKTPHDTKIVDFPKTLDEIQGLVLFWVCDAVFWVHWRLLGWTFRLLLSSKRMQKVTRTKQERLLGFFILRKTKNGRLQHSNGLL